jgi:hypothetical protein
LSASVAMAELAEVNTMSEWAMIKQPLADNKTLP